ncbi:outer membrane beta-barrel protein [Hydrocarboniphaga sp.]|uniref:outer membrane beta-barrel protein n=1 Tax=Hydrocarboniphaga sp. TaxID=2033016 RepID=UPI002ABBD13C|nr:outer membrane beta-barrel protein [Hydrocarboniphaga sp.]MDZ4080449.1 outer membrane beta-barrel protein [Hydrocarboniphaga sp.]
MIGKVHVALRIDRVLHVHLAAGFDLINGCGRLNRCFRRAVSAQGIFQEITRMNVKKLLMLATLAAPSAAWANEQGHIDGYYIPYSAYETDDGTGDSVKLEGDGFGVKGMIPLGYQGNFFAIGEYQSTSQDKRFGGGKVNTDLDQFRLGGGFQVPLATGTGAVYAEYINVDQDLEGLKFEPDGFGIHGRLSFPISPGVNLYGQIGYVSLSDGDIDADGPEYLIGGSVDFTPNIGAFIDFRYTDLKIDFNDGFADEDDAYSNVRLGVRVLF